MNLQFIYTLNKCSGRTEDQLGVKRLDRSQLMMVNCSAWSQFLWSADTVAVEPVSLTRTTEVALVFSGVIEFDFLMLPCETLLGNNLQQGLLFPTVCGSNFRILSFYLLDPLTQPPNTEMHLLEIVIGFGMN